MPIELGQKFGTGVRQSGSIDAFRLKNRPRGGNNGPCFGKPVRKTRRYGEIWAKNLKLGEFEAIVGLSRWGRFELVATL